MGAGELFFTIIRIVLWAKMSLVEIPWDLFPVSIWTNVQEAIGVICICLPALGPLMKRRARKSTAQYVRTTEHSDFRRPKSMGPMTLQEKSLDENHDDDMPLKELKRSRNSIIKSSFVIDADQESI